MRIVGPLIAVAVGIVVVMVGTRFLEPAKTAGTYQQMPAQLVIGGATERYFGKATQLEELTFDPYDLNLPDDILAVMQADDNEALGERIWIIRDSLSVIAEIKEVYCSPHFTDDPSLCISRFTTYAALLRASAEEAIRSRQHYFDGNLADAQRYGEESNRSLEKAQQLRTLIDNSVVRQ